MKRMAGLGALVALPLMAGCTVYVPHSVSMGGVVMPDVKVVGRVEGTASAKYILGFGPFGDDSLKAAVADALAQQGGDTLVNVTVDRSIMGFPHPSAATIYKEIKTTVSGTAIKFTR